MRQNISSGAKWEPLVGYSRAGATMAHVVRTRSPTIERRSETFMLRSCEQTADTLHDLLREMHRERGLTSIIATHNPRLADSCDRVPRLENGTLREAR